MSSTYREKSALMTFPQGQSRTRKSQLGDRYGDVELIKFGYSQYDWYRCPRGHEQLQNTNDMRRRVKRGEPAAPCPTCKAAAK